MESTGAGRSAIGTMTPPNPRASRNSTLAITRLPPAAALPRSRARARRRRPIPRYDERRHRCVRPGDATRARRDRDEPSDLDEADPQHDRQLGRNEAGRAERRPAQPLQDPVAAFVGRGDAQVDEAAGDDREGERAGQCHAHGARRQDNVPGEQEHRDWDTDHREGFAPPRRQATLHAGLGDDRRRPCAGRLTPQPPQRARDRRPRATHRPTSIPRSTSRRRGSPP